MKEGEVENPKGLFCNWIPEPMGYRQDNAGKTCLVSKTYW